MAMSPAIGGAASPAVSQTATLAAGPGAPPDPSGMMADTIGQIRSVAQAVDQLGSSNPALAQGVQQIKQILRQMIVAAASQASVQTASSEAVPMGG